MYMCTYTFMCLCMSIYMPLFPSSVKDTLIERSTPGTQIWSLMPSPTKGNEFFITGEMTDFRAEGSRKMSLERLTLKINT